MKREDYEWLLKILASVVNAGDRGHSINLSISKLSPGTKDDVWYIRAYSFDEHQDYEFNFHWIPGKRYSEATPEEIVKVVNAL